MLAGELEAPGMSDDGADVGTSIRLPRDLLDRADRLAARRAELLGERASRSAVLRLALERGVAALEREAADLASPAARASILAELDALRERVAALEVREGEGPGHE
jgi:predicted DNA-binding protein